MGARDLTVDQLAAATPELLDQVRERDLRCVSFAAEHRLAEEDAPQHDPVKTTDQSFPEPGLDRMRVPESVQPLVGGPHRACDPRSFRPQGRVAAASDDLVESPVERAAV